MSPPPRLEGTSNLKDNNPFKNAWASSSNSSLATYNPKSPPLPPRPKAEKSKEDDKDPRQPKRRTTTDEPSRRPLSPPPSPPKRKPTASAPSHAHDQSRKISSTTATALSTTSAPPLIKRKPSKPTLLSSSHLGMQTNLRPTPPLPSHGLSADDSNISNRARSDSSTSASSKQKQGPHAPPYIYAAPAPAFPIKPEASKRGVPPVPPVKRSADVSRSNSRSDSPVDPLTEPLPHSAVFVGSTATSVGLARSKTTGAGRGALPPPPPKRRPDSLYGAPPAVAPLDEASVPHPLYFTTTTVKSARAPPPPAAPSTSKVPDSNPPTSGERKQFRESVKEFTTKLEVRGQPEWLSKAGQKLGVMPGGRTEKQSLMGPKNRTGKEDVVEEEDDDDDRRLRPSPSMDFTDDEFGDRDRERERMRAERESGWSRLD
ncbi:hypothetical protein BT69DRAFT_154830 [Atractiella rhizophila]|nr:hypothetical protein BT69DRAFT_154830 [Atractiella rhizophila]